MLRLLSFICAGMLLSTSNFPPAQAQSIGAETEQPAVNQGNGTNSQNIRKTEIDSASLNNPNNFADKTNEAAQLCREARQFSDGGMQEKARNVLQRATSLDPNGNSDVVHNQLGLAYSRLGNPKAALSEFSQALSFSPENRSAMLNLAECYKQLGELEQSKFYLKRFIDETPDSPERDQAKSSLSALRHTGKITGDKEASDYLDSVTKKGMIGWSQRKMPLKIFIEDGSPVFGYQDSYRNLVQKSLWQWMRASEGRLKWRLVYDRPNADIVIHWTSDKSDFPHGAEQGIAKLTTLGHCIEHADLKLCTVFIESNETKVLPPSEMEQTCLHEIGHALGLAGHSSNNSDVMFFCVRPYPVTQLTERDRNAIARLYTHDFVEPRGSQRGGLTIGIPGLFGVRF